MDSGYDLQVLKQLAVIRQRGACSVLPEVDSAWAESTSGLLKALADPTRLTMVAAMWKAEVPICICDFTASLDLSQPTISHHMGKLREVGLVESQKQGIWIYYRLKDALPNSTRRLLSQLLS